MAASVMLDWRIQFPSQLFGNVIGGIINLVIPFDFRASFPLFMFDDPQFPQRLISRRKRSLSLLHSFETGLMTVDAVNER
jgi:hypothetical protein